MKNYIGIDNGVTGAIAIIGDTEVDFIQTPIKKEQNYTKSKQIVSRIDAQCLESYLRKYKGKESLVILERPMIFPGRFKATLSAMRSMEATLIIVELLELPLIYIDSKEWQRVLLPSGLEKEDLKKASLDIGSRLFPQFKKQILKQKDADALLIAEYARRKGL